MSDLDIFEAHERSSNHREECSGAHRCGCFYCLAEFPPAEITEWIDPATDDGQGGSTALCPKCGVDSVLPMVPGVDSAFLRRMREHWF